ncbi:MAG: hypothetical protein KKG14_07090 [Alphaproteobacteria bacterium]|nr:hypothetical protein [Alphaproteobacteria bacterium]MBU2270773.1 hypothetical protein [Alphaproteobacteria bacterium]MBU2418450.1 hypothetical protein [Alphaproteobacteria bacterium]
MPVAALLAALVAQAEPGAPPACAALTLEPGLYCAQAPMGVVVSDDDAMAVHFAGIAAAGEARFRRHFEQPPTPYAVIVGERANPLTAAGMGFGGGGALQQQLRQAGARHILPWTTAAQRAELLLGARRSEAEGRRRAEGLTGDALDAAVAADLDAAEPAPPATAGADSGAAHELGHMWAIRAYWPDARGGGHYGGPADDWFDESAAVLMEDEALGQTRRAGFAREWRTPGGARPRPLAVYFADTHPLFEQVQAELERFKASAGTGAGAPGTLTGEAVGDPQVRTLNGQALDLANLPPGAVIRTPDGQPVDAATLARLMGGAVPGGEAASGRRPPRTMTAVRSLDTSDPGEQARAVMFYAQARVFADFLLERTGDPAVYGRIARALADGRTMDQWLAVDGAASGLPGSVTALDAAWMAWLADAYGPAA